MNPILNLISLILTCGALAVLVYGAWLCLALVFEDLLPERPAAKPAAKAAYDERWMGV